MPTLTTLEFITRAQAAHGKLYSYKCSSYTRCTENINIRCRTHGIFTQLPSNHIKGYGCPSCGGNKPKTSNDFLKTFKQIHGTRYDYSLSVFGNIDTPITIVCKTHGIFKQSPYAHLRGRGCLLCPKLTHGLRSNVTDFIVKARQVHGEVYDYSKSVYINSLKPLTILCLNHGEFRQTPGNHLSGNRCPSCTTTRYSKKAIRWIEQYAYSHRLKNVQHAENGGEYRIPGTRFNVDGFHARSNTVFEFHGSCYHGDPSKYKPNDQPHPFNTKTARQLYKTTYAEKNS